jgi:N-acetyl-anhydromuramyl-L-alanine amidase AmpD
MKPRSRKGVFVWLASLWLAGCASYQPGLVVDRPIPFGNEREALTREYLQQRYGLPGEDASIRPRMVVLHWTAIPTLEGSFGAFEPETLPDTRGDIQQGGALNVSAHYLVDRDGTIYRLLPDTLMARHTIGLNHCAIGVENVGGTPQTPLTPAQLRSNVWLVRQLARKYPIEYVIGHHEYTLFEGHPLRLEKEGAYRTEKTDPGKEFMEGVREELNDLPLKPLPNTPQEL